MYCKTAVLIKEAKLFEYLKNKIYKHHNRKHLFLFNIVRILRKTKVSGFKSTNTLVYKYRIGEVYF